MVTLLLKPRIWTNWHHVACVLMPRIVTHHSVHHHDLVSCPVSWLPALLPMIMLVSFCHQFLPLLITCVIWDIARVYLAKCILLVQINCMVLMSASLPIFTLLILLGRLTGNWQMNA